LNKELARLRGEWDKAKKQLSNPGFLANAPEEVVNGVKQRKSELEVLIGKAQAALNGLGQMSNTSN
jgi:valyl-tRNA synthetase